MSDKGGGFGKFFAVEQFFRKQNNAVIQTPGDKIPAGSVPQTRKPPNDENIKTHSALAEPVAAEGNIQIIPKPGAERYMPAPPKFGYAL